MLRRCVFLALAFSIVVFGPAPARAAGQDACDPKVTFGHASPVSQGVNPRALLGLTEWVRDNPVPIFSFLISRNGKVVYQLIAPGIGRDDAHYVMSVTKSVTAALVGAAIDRHLLGGPGQRLTDALPPGLPKDEARTRRLEGVTIRDVLGMSALDAQVAPHEASLAARDRLRRFASSPDRFAFALDQKVLGHPGSDFQYTDVTPMIAAGLVQNATGQSLLDFANAALFDPMGFRNVEWMHQDRAGYDNGAYGLRLRPVDMQKFGVLFLAEGCWAGRRLLSREWVRTSLTPWIRSRPSLRLPIYGWYWWQDVFAGGRTAHTANGRKGQRISIFPDLGVVVSMTALAADGTADALYATAIDRFVIPSVTTPLPPAAELPGLERYLVARIGEIERGATRVPPDAEARMVPSAAAKEIHRPFRR